MPSKVGTAFEVGVIVVVSAISLCFLYWLLRAYLGLSIGGVVLLLTPTTILLMFAGVYGYYIGYQRAHNGAAAEARIKEFSRRFRIVVFALLVLLPLVLAGVSLLFLRDIAETVIFAVIFLVVTLWAVNKIRAERRVAPKNKRSSYL